MAAQPLVFFDCPTAADGAAKAWSPNTWKTRLSLNYKGLPYKTVWVELCDVAALYASHNAAPSNDSPSAAPHERCTVPALHDPNTGKFVSDSFKISKYLDETYPEKPLFPRGSLGLQYTFDQITIPELTIMSVAMLVVVGTVHAVPTRTADYLRSTRAILKGDLSQISPAGSEARAGHLAGLKKALGRIAKAYVYDTNAHAGTEKTKVSFLMGPEVGMTYADLALAARLLWLYRMLPKEEYDEVASWDGGRWGTLIAYLDGEGYMKVDEGEAWQPK